MDQPTQVVPPRVNAAKFVFLYLLHLVSLVFVATSLGGILFQIINKMIADPIVAYTGSYSETALKFSISAIIVATPIFFVVSSFINKSLFTGELKKDSGVRRWLTYLILFISFGIFVGWLIAFVNNFLNGELTMKFILKTVSVLVIAAGAFSYYFYDILRKEVENKKDKVIKIYFFSSLAVIVIVFVASFFVVESPNQARDRKLDDEIINNNFNAIDQCVDQYYRENKKLPVSFPVMQPTCVYLTSDLLRDSQTGQAFVYEVIGTSTYQICANFRTSNVGKDNIQRGIYPTVPMGVNDSSHQAGYQCLKRQVFPEVKSVTQ
jgi:hypothetical protein